MSFLVLRHVDGDQVPLTAVECVGKGKRGFRLAHSAGPTRRNTPIGRLGSVRFARAVRIRWAIASRACVWPMTALFKLGPEIEHRLNLVRHHLADRNTGPAGDDLGDGLRIDADLHQWRLALEIAKLAGLGRELGLHGGQIGRQLQRLASVDALGSLLEVTGLDAFGQGPDLLDALLLVLPAQLKLDQSRSSLLEFFLKSRRSCRRDKLPSLARGRRMPISTLR